MYSETYSVTQLKMQSPIGGSWAAQHPEGIETGILRLCANKTHALTPRNAAMR